MNIYAVVKRRKKIRKGRGFSQKELKKIGISFKQAFNLGIPIDPKRSTEHSENVEALKKHINKKATTMVVLNLIEIKGIGQKRSKQLKAAGFDSINKLIESESKEIAEKVGVTEKRASKWIENAKKILTEKTK